MGVGVDGDEEVGALLVGEARAIAQGDEVVAVAREQNLHVELVLDQARHAPGDVEHEVLFLQAARPDRARVVAAVPGVEHDHAQRRHRVAAIAGGRRLGRTQEVEDEPRRVGQRRRLDLARAPLEDDLQDGVAARALEPRLRDEAVADLLGAGVRRQAEQADARFLAAARLDASGERAGRLEHDARERRIGAEAQLLEGDRRGRRRRTRHEHARGGRGRRGGRHRLHRHRRFDARLDLGQERVGDEPHAPAHPHRGVEHHRHAVDEDARPVARHRDDVAGRAQLRLRALGRGLQAGLEHLGHAGELDVLAALVHDRGRARQRAARQQQEDQARKEAEAPHDGAILATPAAAPKQTRQPAGAAALSRPRA